MFLGTNLRRQAPSRQRSGAQRHLFINAARVLLALCALVLAACGPDLALLNSPKDLYITSLIVTATGEGWAVGLQPGRGQPILLHEQHGAWQVDAHPPPSQQGDTLRAVALAGSTLWVAGARSDATHGDATQESGFAYARGADGVWHRQTFGAVINALAFVSPTEGWAVGSGGAIYHDLNGIWTQAANSMDNVLYGLAFRSPTDGWAVGEMGAVVHYDGTSWTHQAHFTHANLYGVALSADDGWAVGDDGTTLRLGSNNQWFEVATPNVVTGRAVTIANGNVWVVGDHGLVFERTGDDAQWHHIPPPADAQLNTVCVAPSGEVWVGANLGSNAVFDLVNGSWQTSIIPLSMASTAA